MKIARKNFVFLAGLALVISVMVLVSLWAFSKIREEADGRKNSFGVLDSANKLMSSLIDAKLAELSLNSIGDAVLTTDSGGFVTLLNLLAEKLTGWTQVEANDQPYYFNLTHRPGIQYSWQLRADSKS